MGLWGSFKGSIGFNGSYKVGLWCSFKGSMGFNGSYKWGYGVPLRVL